MPGHFNILKNAIYCLCFMFFIAGCKPSPEKEQEPKKAASKTYTVEIRGMKFQPAELVVRKGDTVVWVNKDIVAHDVTEEPGKAWSSSTLVPGQSWSLIVTQSANYYCSIHVVMKGKLTME